MKATNNIFVNAFALTALIILILNSCGPSKQEIMEKELKDFISEFEAKVIPLSKESNLAYFDASISGKKEDFEKSAGLELQLSKIFTNKEDFAKLKRIKESGLIADELLKRQLVVLYNSYLGKQIDANKLEEIIELQTRIEMKYANFRAVAGEDTLTDNQLEETLKSSISSEELQQTWLASKKIGKEVAEDIIRLVKKRNETAREIGFDNFQEMKLKLGEQDPQELEQLFDELDDLTRDAFATLKGEIDDYLAKRYTIDKEELMPWHYQNRFFQEAPGIYDIDFDKYFEDKDIVELTSTYFNGIGLPIDDMLEKSDLYEKEGKNQHAYCIDIDKKGDIRVLCNIKPNANWMGTMLHEYGHAVYNKFLAPELPYVLKDPAHTFTTEAIAMIFGRFATNPQWMKDMVQISDDEKAKITDDSFNNLKLGQLVFSRWVQVMYRFEKSMYENPDQDLNKLWWDLVEKYQMLKRPENRDEPDWATKIHVALYPCYYHNYLLGELLASQLYFHIAEKVLKSEDLKDQSFYNRAEVGSYLKEKVFAPGGRYYWNDMIERATGEKLTPKYYAKQFVE